jgi:hypothetical protein
VNFEPNEKKVERKALSREGKFCNFRQFWDDSPYFCIFHFSIRYTVFCTEKSELRPLTVACSNNS